LEVWIYSLVSVFCISMISLIGVATVGMSIKKLNAVLLVLVSFSVGALFGSAFFHLLPEAFHEQGFGPEVPIYVMIGLMGFFVLEKFIHWRHCHVPASKEHLHPVVFMNFIGDALHNFIDGILIGSAFLVSIPIGISASIAVMLHEIPQEIGDFGTLVFGGLSVKRALFLNFISAMTAILGVIVVLVIGQSVIGISKVILPLTAGGFIYIAGADLIPELRKETSLRKSAIQFVSILAGLFVMYIMSTTLGHHHH
jgi:zinc and cadmium transporter